MSDLAVLDSSFLIDARKDRALRERVLARLHERGEERLVATQAAIEAAAGERDPVSAFGAIARAFTIVPLDDAVGAAAAGLARAALRAGSFPGWSDVQIAATAAVRDTFVVTANPRHFRPLGVEAWDYRNEDAPPR